ncbi:WASH complex subunit 2 [Cydia pomonella]|uniref:WASH complex subunit 2 n=1 Tax=Cydia pomonella TaxID=82600 RepID=UPI002ADDD9F6|nr:WASH complex subunit 2 [Cydia pomonella]XP_061727831.1 WASH complex subunit 2 [Cydia pomonella]
MEGTAALRGAAPRWSLAGDQQLLDLLQDIHQRIISKCNETNKRLDEMSRGLRDASVNLQNVNNKFLALSNTQFVESRVYEDDADVAPPAVEKEPPKPKDLASDLTKLKESLQILESYHEPLLIVRDSDSDSDSDENDDRLVLKPKDLYADRPLPYIIGSQAWKSKWHAGLVPDESDSDSSTSKVEEVEQYSESEEERPVEHYMPDRTMSTSTLSLQSEAPVSVSPVRPSPAAVAADLARRLGGDIKIPEREPVYTQPETVPRKLYKPQEPLATTIFPDEPPPLDDQSSDDDIFAELHKSQPKPHSSRVEDLFDFSTKPSGLEEALFGTPKVQTNQNIDKPPLFPEDSETKISETTKTVTKEQPEDNIKKPVGGISLFGTNKHAESIGAAILKRNRRKSSTSGDESNTEEVQVKEPVKEKKERDIFDDLFAKSEKLNKKNDKSEVVKSKPVQKEVTLPKEAKKDIFSDIFDDIDDIFSSDIVVQVKPTVKNDKSLFSDDDDLFAEVSTVKKDSEKDKVVSEKSNSYGAKPKVATLSGVTNVEKGDAKKENKVIKEIKETTSIFDSDSDDGLFTNISKNVKRNIDKESKPVVNKLKDHLFDDDDDGLFTKSNTIPKVDKNIGKMTEHSKKALFDSDDELFKDTKNIIDAKPSQTCPNSTAVANMDDELFTANVIPEKQSNKPDIINSVNIERNEVKSTQETNIPTVQPTVTDSINNDIDNNIPPFESQKKTTPESSHDSFDDEDTKESTSKNNNKYADINQYSENKGNSGQSKDDIFSKNILRTTRIAADEENIHVTAILNDSDDGLFHSKPKIPNTENVKQVQQTTIAPQTSNVFSSADKNDIFTDIFNDVPPVFEKPNVPKKSKNVNALFDDDSDDEALFFKKSDIITDEKPVISPSEERFGIFNDEPPAIDIDFTQKPSKKEEVIKTAQKSEDPPTFDRTDSMSSKAIETDIISKSVEERDPTQNIEAQDTTDDTAKETKKIGKLKPMNININVNSLLPGASPKKKQIENVEVKQEHTASNEELHKADKTEPKMVKSISFDDPEILDNKISKERAKIQVKRRPSTRRARKEAARKSAIDFTDSSFDSSNDNSTKEEVKEKVVKTVYILNDDDIFGSTKTNDKSMEPTRKHLNIVDSDEELFKKPEKKTEKDNVIIKDRKSFGQPTVENKSSFDPNEIDDMFKKSINTKDISNDEIDKVQKDSPNEDKSEGNVANVVDEIKRENVSKKLENKSFLDSDDDDDLFRPTNKKSSVNTNDTHSDEKLFKSAQTTQSDIQKVKEPGIFSNLDEDDLFKAKTKITKPELNTNVSSDEDIFQNKGIGTLGKVYNKTKDNVKENKTEELKDTHNIFDDFPAKSIDNNIDEIQQSKVVKEPIVETVKENVEKAKKSILDDLSDEDDLFKSKTKLISKKDTSLFGDDGDDDDLFGTKPAKEIKQDVSVILPVKEPKTAEPVFVDPLSLFDDDD